MLDFGRQFHLKIGIFPPLAELEERLAHTKNNNRQECDPCHFHSTRILSSPGSRILKLQALIRVFGFFNCYCFKCQQTPMTLL